jgi:hypothetical protein
MDMQLVVFLQPFGDFEAGDLRQLDVHQDQVRAVRARKIERFQAVAGADRLVAAASIRSRKSFMLSSLSSTIITFFEERKTSGVIQFILAHEPTLLQFAEHAGIDPAEIGRVYQTLPLGDNRHERST